MTHLLPLSAFVFSLGFISNHAIAEAQNCSSGHIGSIKFGSLGDIEYGGSITPLELSRKALKDLAEDSLHFSRVDPLPGEETIYVSEAMEYLSGAQFSSYSCLIKKWQEGDELRPFIEVGEDSKRTGYVLTRKGEVIVFLYELVANV